MRPVSGSFGAVNDEVAGARAPCPHCGKDHAASVLKCPSTDLVLPLQGRVLAGRFQLVRELGRGGMAEVWLALNTAVDRLVALKLIRPEVVKRAETVARFRSEARAAGRIEHPNICQIHDFGSSPIGPFIVMEYLRGCSLAELLSGGRKLEVPIAVGVVTQALAGLSAAHREGIVHRDLKPENVFLHVPENGPAALKLMDFGVSKLTDGTGEIQTEHGALLGTPEYMAPEQVGRAAAVDERSDLWAIGAILYRALTGHLPFKGPTIAATLLELTNTEPRAIASLAPEVPDGLDELVMSCLDKDRERRPADADTLAAALAPWSRDVPLATLVAASNADVEHAELSGEPLAADQRQPASSDDSGEQRKTMSRAPSADQPRAAAHGAGTGLPKGRRPVRADSDDDDDDDPDQDAKTRRVTALRGVELNAAVDAELDLQPDPEPEPDPEAPTDEVAPVAKVDPKSSHAEEAGQSLSTVARLAAEARALDDAVPAKAVDDRTTVIRETGSGNGSSRWIWIAIAVAAVIGLLWWLRGPSQAQPPAAAAAASRDDGPKPIPQTQDDETAGSARDATGTHATTTGPDGEGGGPTGGHDSGDSQTTGRSTGETSTTAQTSTTADADAGDDDLVVIEDTDGAEPTPAITPSSPRPKAPSTGAPTPAPPTPPRADPGGTFRVGDYLVLRRAGPKSTHSSARKYCQGLAKAAHMGIKNWSLPNPAVARQLAASRRMMKTGRYWTSARYQGRARVLAMPKGELLSEEVTTKRVKALCVARSSRPS